MKRLRLLPITVVILVLALTLPSCTDLEQYGYGIDTDGDGWTDTQEATAGTSPDEVDSDGDGYWDPHDANPLDPSITGASTAPEPGVPPAPPSETPGQPDSKPVTEPEPELPGEQEQLEPEAAPPPNSPEAATLNELHAVQEAVDTMMRNNGITVLQNPVMVPTDNMQRFPDISTTHGLNGVGYVLYLHDYDGNGSPDTNYFPVRTTRGTYVCNAEGHVTQVTTGYEE